MEVKLHMFTLRCAALYERELDIGNLSNYNEMNELLLEIKTPTPELFIVDFFRYNEDIRFHNTLAIHELLICLRTATVIDSPRLPSVS